MNVIKLRERSFLLAGSVAILLSAVVVAELRSGTDQEATVTRVYDGDTIEADVDGRSERIRYIGIDSPELSDPRQPGFEWAQRAARANRELVDGRRVRLELDVRERDRFGRLLAYVWLADTLVNEWLVRGGYAVESSFPPNLRYQERFQAAQQEAEAAGRGWWSGPMADQPVRVSSRQDDDEVKAASGARPGDGVRVTAVEAERQAGRIVTVCDSVAGTKYLGGGRRTFLNLVRDYPDQPFTVVIPGEVRGRFREAPESLYRDRQVCVAGSVTIFRETPQIIVYDPGQLELR